ncbi:hypothetical protein LAZ40_04185 [Cereibacter sphaeroides]|uniref:DNA-methyltransferase n=1 Tax=Cereibacter sphaeroides TaxID=1063 RepID=UPI001F30C676|nr:DNA methyltransferase [Cereibacter sphaeroides]MCE6958253.1 hypothetical protein [Cereibacter sphaeroides]MCE6971119.1 hypothetical protein [Cereibacter sphaeroides]
MPDLPGAAGAASVLVAAPAAPALGGRYPELALGPVRLIRGSCLEVLPDFEGEADLLVTDPPYLLSSGGNGSQVMGGKFARSRYDNSGRLMKVVRWGDMGEPFYRACRADADAYVMTNDKNLPPAQAAFFAAGWRLHNILVWEKEFPTRNRWYMKELEFTTYLFKGKARTIRNPGSKQRFACPRPRNAIHNTQKPVELFTHYILNSSDPGDLVLDPFSGSGTCLVAAMTSGRRGLAIELEPEMFEISSGRLRLAWDELRRREDRAG